MVNIDWKSEFLTEEQACWRTSGGCLVDGPIGKETLVDVKIPILSLTLACDSVAEGLVIPFDQSIGLGMVRCREVVIDLPFLRELGDQVVLEFQSVVRLDVSWGTILTIEVGVDEFGNFCASLLRKWGCFRPSCQAFYCDSNESISTRSE